MAGDAGCEAKSKTWVVMIEGRKPFSMGGDPMTHAEALEVARCIWATTEPGKVAVEAFTPKESKNA